MFRKLALAVAMLLFLAPNLNTALAAGDIASSLLSGLLDLVFRESSSGILVLGPEAPSEFTHDGITYQSEFCENAELRGEDVLSDVFLTDENHSSWHVVDNEHFSIIFCKDGMLNYRPYGTLYCAETDWEAAHAYYTDPANWEYYCCFNDGTGIDPNPDYCLLPDVDAQKFLELQAFSQENAYDPFSPEHNDDLLRMPLPDPAQHPVVYFSRISRDGLLEISSHTFHFVDGKLLLLYQYDYGHGAYEDLLAIEVPDELNAYFAPMIKNP